LQGTLSTNQLNVTAKTDALTHTTTFAYDANGNRLTETDPTGTVTYTYNQFGEVLTRTDQMSGVTTNTYDAQGNLLTTKDALSVFGEIIRSGRSLIRLHGGGANLLKRNPPEDPSKSGSVKAQASRSIRRIRRRSTAGNRN